jgi:cytochrome bd ubiquinol oxidase subunit II
MIIDLPLIWAAIIAFAVFAYVVLDGFDLGIGILFWRYRDHGDRDMMINSVAPVWDGNETWLVLGGGGLFAAFPLAYAVLLPALYAPLTAMLLALVFRGVAFEFRERTHLPIWDYAFALGSTVAAFCQGVALGAVVQGVNVEGRSYAGDWFDWLTPFSLAIGAGLVCGYALLGAGWLILKTGDELQQRLYRTVRNLAVGVLLFIGLVSLWTPLLHTDIAARWFAWPNIALLAPLPLLVGATMLWLYRGIVAQREHVPFLAGLALFALSYAGIGISLFPWIIPRKVTIWQAAAPDGSLSFLLVGTVVLVPIILAYTGYNYWIFRGKVRPGEGYH